MKPKKIGLLLIIIFLLGSIIFENKISIVKYFDEVLVLVFLLFTIFNLLLKRIKLSLRDTFLIFTWIGLIFIGIISNVFIKIDRKIFEICLDIVSFSKLFIFIICTKYLFSYKTVDSFFDSLVKISKCLVILLFVLSIGSVFFDFGMRGQKRFGIYGFNFIFEYAHEFSVFVLCLYTVLYLKLKKRRDRILYSFLIFFVLILTLKGPSMLIPFIFLGFSSIYKYKNKLNVLIILSFLMVICIWISKFQIINYLTNENAPRYLLFKYGFITARNYFPFGSGFGTYGSSIAASAYSPLYEAYGFSSLYGMSPEDYQFLNDTYYPMIIGQFGILGALIMSFVFYSFFKTCFQCYNRKNKIISSILLCYFIIHSVGSAILTSSAGVLGLIFISLVWKYDEGKRKYEV